MTRIQTELFPLTNYTSAFGLSECSGGDDSLRSSKDIQLSIRETLTLTFSPPEQLPDSAPERHRRHTPKGEASGWIEERTGNKKRQNPSVSYYYCWDDAEGRYRKYIPAGKLWRVQQMWKCRRSVDEIVAYLMNE